MFQESFSEEQLKLLPVGDGKTLGDKLALAIGSIGENMNLARAIRLTTEADTQLVGYCHPSTVAQDMKLGRYGAIVAFKASGPLTEVAKQLCVHVIGKVLNFYEQFTLKQYTRILYMKIK